MRRVPEHRPWQLPGHATAGDRGSRLLGQAAVHAIAALVDFGALLAKASPRMAPPQQPQQRQMPETAVGHLCPGRQESRITAAARSWLVALCGKSPGAEASANDGATATRAAADSSDGRPGAGNGVSVCTWENSAATVPPSVTLLPPLTLCASRATALSAPVFTATPARLAMPAATHAEIVQRLHCLHRVAGGRWAISATPAPSASVKRCRLPR